MCVKTIKYLLDLSELFSDHRRKAYILHRDSWTTVGCIARTIRETFQIEHALHICNEDGIFYPASETIDIIWEDNVLKILPAEQLERNNLDTQDESHDKNTSNTLQESSTYEDIESVLLGLPKPKRRRVRKRKVKATETDKDTIEQPSPPAKRKVKETQLTEQNGHIHFASEETQPRKEKEDDLPYRNLNQTMKARVVRAVSPSALNNKQPGANALNIESIPEVPVTPSNEANQLSKSVTKAKTKARVIRAIGKANTLEIKQEQLEAASAAADGNALQQPVNDDTVIIELDPTTPTFATREEATRDIAMQAV